MKRWSAPVFWLLGLANLANGLWMLFAPAHWFLNLPAGVPDTGPFNQHFVRDVGAAFATLGVAFLAAARDPRAQRGVLLAGALFYALHAFVHVADLITGRLHATHWGMDLPGVFLPAVLLMILAVRWPAARARGWHGSVDRPA
jgi:predicted anti-sigma-YlaC factor YlaD